MTASFSRFTPGASRPTRAFTLRLTLAVLVGLCSAVALGTAPAGAATTTSPALSVLVDPPIKPADIFDDQRVYDSSPAGICVNWADVYDPAAQHGSGTQLGLSLSYPGSWRENIMQVASTQIRLSHEHLAIWLYRWNGYGWVYANQARFRYPTTTFPYWTRPSSDYTYVNEPYFSVNDGTGYYTIRVALISASGAVVDSAFVKAFGHTNLDGDTPYCAS